MEKHLRVLELMKSKGGTIRIDDPDLQKILGIARISGKELTYRVSSYISFIRRFDPFLEVKHVREGRKVVAYALVDVTSPTNEPGDRVYQHSKYFALSQPAESPAT
jgi:hypothetical protein